MGTTEIKILFQSESESGNLVNVLNKEKVSISNNGQEQPGNSQEHQNTATTQEQHDNNSGQNDSGSVTVHEKPEVNQDDQNSASNPEPITGQEKHENNSDQNTPVPKKGHKNISNHQNIPTNSEPVTEQNLHENKVHQNEDDALAAARLAALGINSIGF